LPGLIKHLPSPAQVLFAEDLEAEACNKFLKEHSRFRSRLIVDGATGSPAERIEKPGSPHRGRSPLGAGSDWSRAAKLRQRC
jgi:hypothetical protein